MNSRFKRAGKIILQDGLWMAEAMDELGAMMILNALRAMEERSDTVCQAYQSSDQMICPCGLQWDVNDPDPPRCGGA